MKILQNFVDTFVGSLTIIDKGYRHRLKLIQYDNFINIKTIMSRSLLICYVYCAYAPDSSNRPMPMLHHTFSHNVFLDE